MAQYYVEIYTFGSGLLIDNDGSGTGTTGLVASTGGSDTQNNDFGSLQNGGWSVGPTAGSRLQVTASSEKIGIWITDDESNLQDGAGDTGTVQTLLYPVTINGVTYPAGSRVELEYAVDVEAGGDGADYYIVRLAGNGLTESAGDTGYNVGILSTTSDSIVVGQVYTVNTSIDGPSITFASALCFAGGTGIETPQGLRRVEDLRAGDLITTRDHGPQILRWVGQRRLSFGDLLLHPALRPVRFDTGSIGNSRPLVVSPQHRMLVADWRAQLCYGEDQVLVPAKALVNGTTIRQVVPPRGVTYFHLMFDGHEILLSDGAWSESFHPGHVAQNALTAAQLAELDLLFPKLIQGLAARETCHMVVRPNLGLQAHSRA